MEATKMKEEIKKSRRWKMSELLLEGKTFKEIGLLFEVSRQRVFQIIHGIKRKTPYRKHLKENCEICGTNKDPHRRGGSLSIHHKNGNHTDNDPINLMTICTQCHATIHAPEKHGMKHTQGFEYYKWIRRKRAYERKYDRLYPY